MLNLKVDLGVLTFSFISKILDNGYGFYLILLHEFDEVANFTLY